VGVLHAKCRELVSYNLRNDALEIFAFHKSANLWLVHGNNVLSQVTVNFIVNFHS